MHLKIHSWVSSSVLFSCFTPKHNRYKLVRLRKSGKKPSLFHLKGKTHNLSNFFLLLRLKWEKRHWATSQEICGDSTEGQNHCGNFRREIFRYALRFPPKWILIYPTCVAVDTRSWQVIFIYPKCQILSVMRLVPSHSCFLTSKYFPLFQTVCGPALLGHKGSVSIQDLCLFMTSVGEPTLKVGL